MQNQLYNLFAILKQGQMSQRSFIIIKRKKICERFLKILWNEGFILGYTICLDSNQIKIFLKYKRNKPVINSIKLISKPGQRIYYSIKQIWKLNSLNFFIIFSTTKGLKSIIDCKKLKIGGEPYIIIN
jgi:small subunit ribosomal protein S8